MLTVTHHQFGDVTHPRHLSISISQVMREDYGLYSWPCSVVLAEYVWQQRHRFVGSSVVELGAGTALPGIVAAKLGANVTLTDRSDKTDVFENMERICEQNGVTCKIQGLTWGIWDSDSSILNPGIVLGADVLYNTRDFDDLFATVKLLLHDNPNAIFITTYERRRGDRNIELLMAKWKLHCTKLLDAYDFMPPEKLSTISTSIELVEIMTKHETCKGLFSVV